MADTDTVDHAALMRRAQAGDEDAFAGLVQSFAGRLFRFLATAGLAAADADDLVQETFIRAHRNLGRYDARWSVSTWLYTIAHRLALNHRRDRRALRSLEGIEPAAAEMVDDVGEDDGIWDLARTVLSPRDVQVLWLRYGEDRSIEDIAIVLGVQPGNAKVVLHRARNRLAEHLPADTRRPAAVAVGAFPIPDVE